MKDLNISNKMKWYPSKVGTYINGKIYPTTSPLDLLRFGALPFTERIKLGLLSLRIKNIKNWEKLEGFTANEWLEKN